MITYTKMRDNLSIEAIAEAIVKVGENPELSIDELSHIVVKGTDTKIGYFGNESIELCNYPSMLADKKLRKYHDYIIDYVLPVVDNVTHEQADSDDS